MQAARLARTGSFSRSPRLAFNSSGSESPPPSSRNVPWEGPNRSPRLVPYTVPSEAVKGHWTQEVYEEPLGFGRQRVLHPPAYIDLQPYDQTWGKERYRSPFIFPPPPPEKDRPKYASLSVSQCTPDRAYLDPHCVFVEYRTVCEPSAFGLIRVIWRGIISAPAGTTAYR